MYNVLVHLEETFKMLEKRGFYLEIPRRQFIIELKRSTSIFNEKTLNRWIHNFYELGYIRIMNPQVIQRCVNFNEPFVFSDGYHDDAENSTFTNNGSVSKKDTPVKKADLDETLKAIAGKKDGPADKP